MKSTRSYACVAALALATYGCTDPATLMPTPSLYGSGKAEVFGELAPELTKTQVELLYATDRAPETDEKGNLRYGFNRSYSLGVGTTVVDLDLSVVSQRLVAERIGLAVGMTTLYSSPTDKAIGIAERLFASPRGRLGTLDISKINKREEAAMEANAARITIVNFRGDPQNQDYGHSYFRSNPAVSSDLVLLLRYGYPAGSKGRPLNHIGLSFWQIPEDYPAKATLD